MINYFHLSNVILKNIKRQRNSVWLKPFIQSIIHLRYSSKISKTYDLKYIRNIGIIAHIDAGKTTTTERMLYYSGFTNSMGEVHDGDTVMDYMVQERERGITITSAAITFNWRKHKINLIDTPGHIDFTFEVERSLSILDGAILILDSSAGVEVQTLKVWEQANRYNVPCIMFLNKSDKPASSVEMCLESIKKKLKAKPLLIQVPVVKEEKFCGVIDLITLQKYIWNKSKFDNDGRIFSSEDVDLEKDTNIFQLREQLIEDIAELNDNVAEKYISNGMNSISTKDLQTALKSITLNKTAVPILCGSAYKNIGVQMLMDAVVDYLPNPCEKNNDVISYNPEDLCALVFKIIHNKQRDPLTFLRIYSGTIKSGQKLYNRSGQISQKAEKLMIPLANDFHEISALAAGNIVVATGLKGAITGDLLFYSAQKASSFELSQKNVFVPIIQVPDPVFFCTVEPPSLGMQNKLDSALQCLHREDPTFRIEIDETIGQTILMGMGELHLDIIKERIRVEYGIDAFLGPLQVAYRESLGKAAQQTHILDKTVSGNKQYVKLTMDVYPCNQQQFQKEVNVIVTKENNLGKVRSDYLKAINSGVKSALNNGPLLSFPVLNVGIDLLWLEVSKSTSLSMLTAAASQCILASLRKSDVHLLEPVMNLSIAVDKGYAGRVLNDLSQKRSQIISMELRQDVEIIQARTPLSELRGYSTVLRAITSGTCSLSLEFDSYQKMDYNEQAKAIEEVTGFSAF